MVLASRMRNRKSGSKAVGAILSIAALCLLPAFAGADEAALGGQSFTTGTLSLRLSTDGSQCAVSVEGSEQEAVKLDLAPPCHIGTWTETLDPALERPSGGTPVGVQGEAMAWKFADREGAIYLAVLGDPVAASLQETLTFKTRAEQGLTCMGSMQALVVKDSIVSAGTKREQVGILCAEMGIDEKSFWLLAHP